MCGRFTLTIDAKQLALAFGLIEIPAGWQPRYNIAPTQLVLGVREAESPKGEWMRWGLIPSWAKDPTIGNRLINARAETLTEKPAFRSALISRRCLILADGFYEWRRSGGKSLSQPFLFRLKNGTPFAFAGLWDAWRNGAGEPVLSCTLITCSANAMVGEVHKRMPVILDREQCWDWLRANPLSRLMDLLRPYPPEKMEMIPVGQIVNNPATDDPVCIQPAR
ncbi:SOS response-associated peptidase [uncultured Thermanaerothrix sp.]|uniref:SOS response-associated peptidase n=1 Tax=uncultured Thermanaerothrix sp. TaxID=1195149 RepID=UPI002629FE2D|nr:SOS response-associated peptidase [uncultured Thermanaerothrix sp.]